MEYYLSLAVFTFVSCATPGPNNMMLLASGLNYGVRKSLPHYFGICIGFLFLVAAVGLGLAAVFQQSPFLHQALKIVGSLYLLYLAWKIAHSTPASGSAKESKPFTFMQAALFQWVNPKAWVIAVGAIATFTIQSNILGSIIAIIVMYFVMGLIAMGIWLVLGAKLKTILNTQKRQRTFNRIMGVLLAISIFPMLFA